MKAKSLFISLALGLGLTLVLGIAFSGSPLTITPPDVAQAAPPVENGTLAVEVFDGDRWQLAGTPGYDRFLTEQQIDLSPWDLSAPIWVRISHGGETAAHIDAVLLDGTPPSHAYHTAEEPDMALRKLAAVEYDVVEVTGRSIVLRFAPASEGALSLALTARIEPEHISQVPFQFPPDNLYQEMTSDAAFYTYVWDSNPGHLAVDGDLGGEGLGSPFFREVTEPGSGHPTGDTYGWVRNDEDTLYVAIDFLSDNTIDGEKDYAKVYVNTPDGLRVFEVSVPEQVWGQPGFVYTERAVYQHKVYEFAIPLSELGLEIGSGTPLALAFAAYGTAAPAPQIFPGWLDPTFGTGGIVTTSISSDDVGRAVALQPGGKILVAGTSAQSGNRDFALFRYNEDGTLDTSFGSGGIVTTAIGTDDTYGQAMAIQPDGKILVAGRAYSGSDDDFALARYEISGTLDTSFGSGGTVITAIGSNWDSARAMAIQPDGKILVAGYADSGSDDDFALARYEISGTLDASFGSGGIVMTDFSAGDDYGRAMAIQPDGKILVAGRTYSGSGDDFALARYEISGTLDASFGSGGIVTTAIGTWDSGETMAIQPDGKILVGGYASSGSTYDFALARYEIGGTLDPSFGSGGIVTTDFGNDSSDRVRAIALQPDGKIVLAGQNSGWYVALARYNSDGSPDDAFGQDGYRVNTDIGFYGDGAYGVVVQPDGRILAAGESRDSGNTSVALARYGLPQCWATVDGVTVYDSVNAYAVQQAVDAASAGDTVKVAGTCAGTGAGAIGVITQPLTLQGGYTTTNWAAPQPGEVTTLDGLYGTVVLDIQSPGVTVDGFTIRDGADDCIVANTGGITVTNNIFTGHTDGIDLEVHEILSGGAYTMPDSAVISNTFVITGTGVDWTVELDGGSTAVDITVGNLDILSNTFTIPLGFVEDAIEMTDLSIDHVDGGQVAVGDVTIAGNQVDGGRYGINFFGTFRYITDTLVTAGDFVVTGNTLNNQVWSSIDIDFYDAFDWHGTSAGTFGRLVIQENDVACAADNCSGIWVSDVGYMGHLYDGSSAVAGDILIEGNRVDVEGEGLFVYYDSMWKLFGTASATVGDSWITGNVITSTTSGVYLQIQNVGSEVYSDTVTSLGQMHVTNNTIWSGGRGVYIDFYNVADEVYHSAQVTLGDFHLAANQVLGGSKGIELRYRGQLNTFVDPTATVQMPTYNLVNNVLARNTDAGVYANANAPVRVVHNTIVSPTVGSGAGIHVLTGTVEVTNTIVASYTTGISLTGGIATEDYNLFAGTAVTTTGGVTSGGSSLVGANPGFADPAYDDYHLLDTSDAIDNGANTGVLEDRDGNSRPFGGYDIGAYEAQPDHFIYLPLLLRNH